MNSLSTSLDEALDALRTALDANRLTAVIAPEIRVQLRSVCAWAVAGQMRPEGLLIRVKQLIREVPTIANADLHRRTEITSRLISLTIVTYANVADSLSIAGLSADTRRSVPDAVLVH
jgi:hypothetical protein